MLEWTYNESTDSYYAKTVCDLEKPITVKLSLTHTYPAHTWLFVAKTENESDVDFRIRVTIPADPDNPDIDDIKNRAESTLNTAMANAVTAIQHTMHEIVRDSGKPMPSKHDMAKSLWPKFLAVKKSKDESGKEIIAENWEGFSAGCRTSYIEKRFMVNFGLSHKDLEALKAGDS